MKASALGVSSARRGSGGGPALGHRRQLCHRPSRRAVLELLTDVLGTRQLWYIHAPDLFAASTSQRALVMLLRSFELDPEAVAWMLTSGHLAGRAWDARLRRLRGDCRLSLDRIAGASRSTNVRRSESLRRLPRRSTSTSSGRPSSRPAPLSTCRSRNGSCPCRAASTAACFSSACSRRASGRAASPGASVRRCSIPTNDAFIATELARRYGLDHTYRATDDVREGLDVALRRFVAGSEGQTRDFGGYADGMAMWKAFFDEGVAGVIRGDEPAMGYWEHYDSESEILRRRRITLAGEYPDGHAVRRLGLVPQHIDERLRAARRRDARFLGRAHL